MRGDVPGCAAVQTVVIVHAVHRLLMRTSLCVGIQTYDMVFGLHHNVCLASPVADAVQQTFMPVNEWVSQYCINKVPCCGLAWVVSWCGVGCCDAC
jgi:hypothetical protein